MAAGALGLAYLAVLWVVFELFVVKEELFACGKDEFLAAINALQGAITEFHGRIPFKEGKLQDLESVAVPLTRSNASLSSFCRLLPGPGPRKKCGA